LREEILDPVVVFLIGIVVVVGIVAAVVVWLERKKTL